MKKLALLSLLAACAFAQPRAQVFGAPTGMTTTTSAVTSANWLAVNWFDLYGGSFSKFRAYVTAVASSPVAADMSVVIMTNSGGSPSGSGVSGCTGTTASNPAASAWLEFTFSGCTLTQYTQYFFVIENSGAGTVTFRTWSGAAPTLATGRSNNDGVQTATGCPGACSWSVGANGTIAAFRMEYAGSVFSGFPMEQTSTSGANEKIYGSNDLGFYFTAPANANPKVLGVVCQMSKGGSPTGNFTGKLYSDNGTTSTVVATSQSLPAAEIQATSAVVGWWFNSGVYTLTGGSNYRFAISDSAADSSSNNAQISLYSVANDANTLSLMPFSGTMRTQYCTGTCTTSSNWTNDNSIPMCALVFDPAGSFASTGGGSTATSGGSAH